MLCGWRIKPYSVDLRERVLTALNRRMPRVEMVTTFAVSLASLKRWQAARRDAAAVAPQPMVTGGSEPTITLVPAEDVRAQLSAFPDATLEEHVACWNADYATSIANGP